MRKNAQSECKSSFNSAEAVAYYFGIDLKQLRICARQVGCNNTPLSCNFIDFEIVYSNLKSPQSE